MTDKQRRAAYNAAAEAERTALLNLRAASIQREWHEMKLKHPDAILLYRVGDFYEAYRDDADEAAQVLGLVLTRRKNADGSVLALTGFPHHSLDIYLPKLVRAGKRVAISETFAAFDEFSTRYRSDNSLIARLSRRNDTDKPIV